MAETVTRFAPSPTGYLHLGHAYSAWAAWKDAQATGGRFLLRMEDIDGTRCRPEFDGAILEDLAWLGLTWEEPVMRQSEEMPVYAEAFGQLQAKGLLYPCFCTRKDIQREIEASGNAPHGPDGVLYPGICRGLSSDEVAARKAKGEAFALRLDMAKALDGIPSLKWTDRDAGDQTATPAVFGDVVLARKDTPTSYHLAVTVDDARQGVTLVTRGQDLFEATHIHRLLQHLLDLPTPAYHHHPLLTDEEGKRFAKRDKALTLRALREAGKTPAEVWSMSGVPQEDQP